MSLERPPKNVNRSFLVVLGFLLLAWAVMTWTLLYVR